jgi:hypothetical protein
MGYPSNCWELLIDYAQDSSPKGVSNANSSIIETISSQAPKSIRYGEGSTTRARARTFKRMEMEDILNKKEIWRDIEGFEEMYQISNLGRVKSLKRISRRYSNGGVKFEQERILKTRTNTSGYEDVPLTKNGKCKRFSIHRLVAKAFLEPSDKPEVNHKDGNKLNNNVSNLEWCTKAENIKHSFKMGLNSTKKAQEKSKKIRYYRALHKWNMKIGQQYKDSIFIGNVELKNEKAYGDALCLRCGSIRKTRLPLESGRCRKCSNKMKNHKKNYSR